MSRRCTAKCSECGAPQSFEARAGCRGVILPVAFGAPRDSGSVASLSSSTWPPDPFELRDLAGDPALADVEAQLRERLDQHLRATGDPVLRGPVANRAGEPDVCQWQEQPDGSFGLTPDDPMDTDEASFT